MEPTKDGKDYIDRWTAAQEEVRRCKSSLNSAECEMSNSTNALGEWMMPNDAKNGEKFCVWYGDSMIQVVKQVNGDYDITVRARGKALARAA